MLDRANFTGKDLIILLLGIAGFAIYFYLYPTQHVMSLADTSLRPATIRSTTADILSENGYSHEGVVEEHKLLSQLKVLDAYQRDLGRSAAIDSLSKSSLHIPTYLWSVKIDPTAGNVPKGKSRTMRIVYTSSNSDAAKNLFDYDIGMLLTEQGEWAGFVNRRELTPKESVQRDALMDMLRKRYKRAASEELVTPDPLPAISDSLLHRLIYFDLEQQPRKNEQQSIGWEEGVDQLRDRLLSGMPLQLNSVDAAQLARYHLNKTVWGRFDAQVDTMFIERINSINAARVYFTIPHEDVDLKTTIQVDIAPTGAMLGITPTHTLLNRSELASVYNAVHENLPVILLIISGLIILVVFYRRMRSRVIDTKGALWVAMLGGVLLPVQIIMTFFGETGRALDSIGELMLIMGVTVGITGTFGVLALFVIFGAGESVTRQFWTQKLVVSDLLRRGNWLNIPVGTTFIRSVCLSGIFLAIWVLTLFLFPHIWFSNFYSGVPVFVESFVALGPVYAFAKQGFMSLLIVGGIVLTLGGLIQFNWNKKWLTGVLITLLLTLMPMDFIAIKPVWGQWLFGLIFSTFITFVYMRWELITAMIVYFLSSMYLFTIPGWIVNGPSPDLSIFLCLAGLTGMLIVFGFVGMYRGQTEQSLPQYIPEYVDELAQEERIKQELQIAKRVQTSFLPIETPAMNGYDVAASCHPANETGGDYYDFIKLDEHRTAVVIGDVSGKGIQAAFYMTFIKGVLHSLCREVDNPADLLSKANTLFYENARRGTFISLVYGIIDSEKHTFTFARGGHNPILLKRAESDTVEELIPTGLALGMTRTKIFGEKVESAQLVLDKGDVLVLYTDGLVEMLNADGKFYGLDRVKYIIQRRAKGSALNMVNALNNDVYRYMGDQPQHDDLTLVAIKVG